MTLPELIAQRYDGNTSAFARALAEELSKEAGATVTVNPTTVRRWLLDPADRHYRRPGRGYCRAIKRMHGDQVDTAALLGVAA